MNTIENLVREALINDDDVINFNIKPQVNKMVYIEIKAKNKPLNRKLFDIISNLPFVNYKFNNWFKQGKKNENCTYYELLLSIKNEYFDNNINVDKLHGKYLQLCINNKINNISDLVRFTVPMIRNLSNYCHIITDKKELKRLRNIKKNYLKFVYLNKLIDNIEVEYKYDEKFKYPDKLFKFTIFGTSFHLRYEQVVDFLPNYLLVSESKNIYKSKIDYTVNDMSFMDNLNILENINNYDLHINTELINTKNKNCNTNEIIISGRMEISTLCSVLKKPQDFFDDIKKDGKFVETLIYNIIGNIPSVNEIFEYKQCIFKVLQMVNMRVEIMQIIKS